MIGWSAQVHLHSKAEKKDLERELQLVSAADHPNVVRHLCAYYCEDAHGEQYVWIAMEMMAHGALNRILDSGWKLWVRDVPAPQYNLRKFVARLLICTQDVEERLIAQGKGVDCSLPSGSHSKS